MGVVIARWERIITAAGSDFVDAPEEELAQFRGQVSNPDDVREFLERWAGEYDNVEEGLGGDADREPVDNSLGNIEIVVSEDDDDEDDEGDDDEMDDFIIQDAEDDEEMH